MHKAGKGKFLLNRPPRSYRVCSRHLDSCFLSVNPGSVSLGRVLGSNINGIGAQDGQERTGLGLQLPPDDGFGPNVHHLGATLEPANITKPTQPQHTKGRAFGSLSVFLSSAIRGICIRAANSNFGTLDRQDLLPFWDLWPALKAGPRYNHLQLQLNPPWFCQPAPKSADRPRCTGRREKTPGRAQQPRTSSPEPPSTSQSRWLSIDADLVPARPVPKLNQAPTTTTNRLVDRTLPVLHAVCSLHCTLLPSTNRPQVQTPATIPVDAPLPGGIMETSSPMAALRPAPPPIFGQSNIFGQHLMPSPLGPFSFQRPNPEYFNLKAVRGSSPAASLAADLSQNFKLTDGRLVEPLACHASHDLSLQVANMRNSAAVPCSLPHAALCSRLLP